MTTAWLCNTLSYLMCNHLNMQSVIIQKEMLLKLLREILVKHWTNPACLEGFSRTWKHSLGLQSCILTVAVIESSMNSSVYQRILESNMRTSVWQLKLGTDWDMQHDNNLKHVSSRFTTEWLNDWRCCSDPAEVQTSTWLKCFDGILRS